MSHRYFSVDKIKKTKRKKNQFINEFLKNNYDVLLISRREFCRRHKENVVNIFDSLGWTDTTQQYIEDCLSSHYWFKDPICYKTCYNNLNIMDFDDKFIEIFGENILTNEKFLTKIKKIRNVEINDMFKW